MFCCRVRGPWQRGRRASLNLLRHKCLVGATAVSLWAKTTPVAGQSAPAGPALWLAAPEVLVGATSLAVVIRLGRPGTVHYGVYPATDSQPATAAGLLDDAASGHTSVGLRGNRAIVGLGAARAETLLVSPLSPDSAYRIYLSATPADSGLAPIDRETVYSLTATMASRQVAGSFLSSTTRTSVGYYVYLPDAYRLHPHTPFPLLVFLHGSGERGNGASELSKVLKWGPPRLIRDGRDFPMIIVTPQLPLSRKEWPVGLLGEVLETTRGAFAIDSTRVYLTGLSAGADGAWAYAMARPAEIAAIVSIAGAGDPAKVCRMRDVPVWAFHGQQDKDDPLDEEQRMVTALNACSPPPRRTARLTVYPRAGHEVWCRTYDGSAGYDIYSWLLENHR